MADLDELLAQARDADPGDRIDFRDPIAAHGEDAIDPMTDWLDDPRLAAFAIRVLARVGSEPANRTATIEALRSVDPEEVPPHIARDIAGALATLEPRARRSGGGSAIGKPGQPGRAYWVMRTSPWEPAFVW